MTTENPTGVVRIALSDDARERLDAPAILPFDWTELRASEVSLLSRTCGFKTVRGWLDAMTAADDDDLRCRATNAFVWLALRRTGSDLAFTDVDLKYVGDFDVLKDEEEDAAGKAEADPALVAVGSPAPLSTS